MFRASGMETHNLASLRHKETVLYPYITADAQRQFVKGLRQCRRHHLHRPIAGEGVQKGDEVVDFLIV